MTKKLKKVFSFIIAFSMIASLLPAQIARVEESVVSIENIDVFGNGVSGDADVLDNDFYYSSYDIKNSLSGNWLAESNLDKVVKFTRTDSGLEFSWDSEKDIKRLDLWILSVGGIEDYTLSACYGGEWSVVKKSTFKKYDYETVEPSASAASMNNATRASYYPIVLEDVVRGEKLRFTIDSFYENNQTNVGKAPVAYISEAKVRSDNNVNLGDLTFYGNTSGGIWSPYLHGFQTGGATSQANGAFSNAYCMPEWAASIWPSFSDTNRLYPSQDFDCSTQGAGIWYISRFWRSKVKVNRVGIELLTGSITEFEVWANRKDIAEPWNRTMEIPITDANWEKVATFRCNLTPSTDDVNFDLPNAFEASQIMIRATKYDDTANYSTKIGAFRLYSLAESDLTVTLDSLKNELFSAIETDEEQGSARREFMLPKSVNGSDVEWSTDSDLVTVMDGEASYKASVKLHDEEAEITLRATCYHISGGIYKIEGTFTLVPFLNQCHITVDGAAADALSDGIFGSAYDKAAEKEASFVSVTEDSVIEYIWDEKLSVSGFGIWAKPGKLENCIIKYKENNADEYVTLDSDKYSVMLPDASEKDDAAYCPVFFDEKLSAQSLTLQIELAEGINEAELSEAFCILESEDLLKAPSDAEETQSGYSHYISQYVAGKTSGDSENPMAQKSSIYAWPTDSSGAAHSILPENGIAWYALGFTSANIDVNKATVPVLSGLATEISILYADGEESGFDWSAADPARPDTRADWKIAATVQGNFITGDIVTVDLSTEKASRYWMVKVSGASNDFAMGRLSLYRCTKAELSSITEVLDGIFEEVITDGGDSNSVKSLIKFPKNYNGCDISWSEGEDIESILTLDASSDIDYIIGNVKDHDKEIKITMTASVTAPGGAAIKYCVKKEYIFTGLLSVSVLKMVDGTLTDGGKTNILTDDFSYIQYDYSNVLEKAEGAFQHPERFIHLEKEGEGFEFSYSTQKTRRRFELWAWPMDSVSAWRVEYFDEESAEWKECGSGEIRDRYEGNQQLRPADQAKDSIAGFYPIIFDDAVTAKRFRFIATAFREADPETGAYISEADLMETNDTNYVMMDSIKLSDSVKKKNPTFSLWSKYIGRGYVSYVEANNSAYCIDSNGYSIWPNFSDGSRMGIKALPPDLLNEEEGEALLWYYTSFNGGFVAVNSASISIKSGTVTEFEVMCSEDLDGAPAWNKPPRRPDTVKKYRTVAKVAGDFGPGQTVKIHFDNNFESRCWLIKITKGENVILNDVGLYSYSKSELDKASRVLSSVFDNVTESGIDNVITDRVNIPETLNITVDNVEESYNIAWTYDNTIINADGTVISAPDDRKTTITALVKSTDGKYSHVVEKDYIVLGQDNRDKTLLCDEKDITVEENTEVDVTPENGFTYSHKQTLEIGFGDKADVSVALNADKKQLMVLTVDKENGKITVTDGEKDTLEIPFSDKIKIELQEGTYAISYMDSNAEAPRYIMLNYGRKLKASNALKSVMFQNLGAQPSEISMLKLSGPSEVLFDEVESQFNFLSISGERATDLNTAPNPIDFVEDIAFDYSSSDEEVISFTKDASGWKCVLDNSQYKSAVVTVTATQEKTGKSFVKSFEVITGKDNVFSEAVSTSKAAAVDGNIAAFALDGCLETSFVTNAAKYNIVLNLGQQSHFNKLRIIPADNTAGSITKYSVDISDDGINYTEDVYTATSLNGSDIVDIGYQTARYVRFNVEQTSARGTGIKEICAYNEMSDQEKLDYEFKALTDALLKVADKTVIPKKGELFGTEFKFSASEGAPVSFVETDDKNGWRLVVGNSSKELTVTITLSAKKGIATDSKNYPLTILASSDIGGNTIGSTAPTVGGGGGGGGGRGGGASATNIPIAPQPEQNATSQSAKLKELEGHWGANEIKNLIADGVVQGDGEKLDLTRSVTRAEFCKMLLVGFNYELEEYKGTFADVNEDAWFARYAETAAKHGIMSGDTNGFRGNAPISRQEMAVVIINLLKAQNEEMVLEKEVSFTDDEVISSWAKESVVSAAASGLLNGYDTGDFKPMKSLQRDEAMVVVYRVISYVSK